MHVGQRIKNCYKTTGSKRAVRHVLAAVKMPSGSSNTRRECHGWHKYHLAGESMGYDTIGIKSPYITEEASANIQNSCVRREGIDLASGEILYQITTGSLEGSYDSRISIKVDNKEWEQEQRSLRTIITNPKEAKYRPVPILQETKPFIYIEASVHKAMLGHNVYGGPENFQECVKWLVTKVSQLIGHDLPNYEEWEVRRVDVAEVYRLKNFEACQEWFRGLNNCTFPRREQVNRYGTSGLFINGSTSVIKFYHKGPEFIKHDRKRLKRFIGEEKLIELIGIANDIIRAEVEIKTRKLQYDFGHVPLVKEVTDSYLHGLHDREVERMLRESKTDLTKVRRSRAVEKRLFGMYDDRLAGILLGTWYRLSAVGEKEVKKTMTKRTFYRHRELLEKAGVSWKGTDVVIRMLELVPSDFSPVRKDPRRLKITTEEAIEYMKKTACI